MKTWQNSLLILAACIGFSVQAYANEKEALDKAYCPALALESSYAKWLDSYKVLFRGKDDWIFRTLVTDKIDFSVKPETLVVIKSLQDKLKEKGTDLVILLPPTLGGSINGEYLTPEAIAQYKLNPVAAKKSYAEMLAALKVDGINAVGVTDYPEGKEFFYRRDHHWNPDGAKASALKVADFIKALPSYAALQKTIFVTTPEGEDDYKGSYIKAFVTICKTRPPVQMVMKYKTVAAGVSPTSEDDLFGKKAALPVVLVGTSNSAAEKNVANFEGFLKEATSLDLENLAIAGAGVGTSLISYLHSSEFKDAPAKILVWEIPGYYDLNQVIAPIVRQAITAVQH
jgi:alginate biosynthesis protein AlgX